MHSCSSSNQNQRQAYSSRVIVPTMAEIIVPTMAELLELGYRPIPLKPLEKVPIFANWQSRSIDEQWRSCSCANPNYGLCSGSKNGIFAGKSLAILDWDNHNGHEDNEALFRYFTGLGVHLKSGATLVVRSAHGGLHVYFSVKGTLPPGHSIHLLPSFGFGEVKIGLHSYTLGPGCMLRDQLLYEVLHGWFDRIQEIWFQDFIPILKLPQTVSLPEVPLPDGSKCISQQLRKLLAGEGIKRFKSRSEMEAAILSRLYLAGFTFPEAFTIFKRNPCGGRFTEEFKANPGKGYKWLENAYQDVAAWVASNPSQEGRRIAEAAIKWAESIRWHGKAGRTDKACFLAHAGTALKYNRVTYILSKLDLARLAEVDPKSATVSNKRLQEARFIELVEKGTYSGRKASSWRLKVGI